MNSLQTIVTPLTKDDTAKEAITLENIQAALQKDTAELQTTWKDQENLNLL